MSRFQDVDLEDLCWKEDDLEGIAFEGYRVVSVLGKGAGGGAVYEVYSATGGRRAAAKWPVHAAEHEALKDLRGCLGVPQLFADGFLNEKPYAVTEILGRPLSDAFAELRPRPLWRRWQTVCVVGRLLLRRLRAIHKQGWLHCDLKPENVLLGSPRGTPNSLYVVDYGNSRRYPGGPPMKADWGSVDFNSIASAAGGERRPHDDIESLGWMLLHLLFGDLPWFHLTKETNWKDREKRLVTVQQVTELKARALDQGWESLGERWRRFTQMPPDLGEFLHTARSRPELTEEQGGLSRPNYKRLAELLGAREGISKDYEEEQDLWMLPLALEEMRRSELGDSHKVRDEDDERGAAASNKQVLWEVIGGGDSGGILVREGKDTSSAQKQDRLRTGAVVQECALDGARLCYRRLLGEGPEAGWVSVKLKERELLTRRGTRGELFDPEERRSYRPPPKAEERAGWWVGWDEMLQELEAPTGQPAASSSSPAPAPDGADARTDILVFGATGITGTLACEMLASNKASKRTWSIAGRDERKLQVLEERYGACRPLFRGAGCASSPEEIEKLVKSARVVVDFSGPMFQIGSGVAEACVKAGTHYIDTSAYEGDVLAARAAREKLHGEAVKKGVSLVFFCSAYPVQVDFGVWMSAQFVRRKYGVPTRRVDVYQTQNNMVLGGTPVLSFLGKTDHVSQCARLNPFVLGGTRQEGPREEDFDEPTSIQHESSGLWLFPGGRNAEVMISRCTCGMLEEKEPYGRRFLLKVWDVYKTKADAELGSSHNAFLRKGYANLLQLEKVPPPGSGPPKALRKAGAFARIFEAKADEQGSKRRRCHFLLHAGTKGVGDACEGTAFVALEACFCLLDKLDGARGAVRAGWGTPVYHLAHIGFSERLVSAGYWTFTHMEKGSPSALLLHRILGWGSNSQVQAAIGK